MLLYHYGRLFFVKSPDGRVIYFPRGRSRDGYVLSSYTQVRWRLAGLQIGSIGLLVLASPVVWLRFLPLLPCGFGLIYAFGFLSRVGLPLAQLDPVAFQRPPRPGWRAFVNDGLLSVSISGVASSAVAWFADKQDLVYLYIGVGSLLLLAVLITYSHLRARRSPAAPDAWIAPLVPADPPPEESIPDPAAA